MDRKIWIISTPQKWIFPACRRTNLLVLRNWVHQTFSRAYSVLAYSRVLARTRVLAQCPLDHFWTRAPNHLFPSSERTLRTRLAKLKNLPVRSCARPLTKFQEDRTIEFFARRRHRWPWSRAQLLPPWVTAVHRASESCMTPGISNAIAAAL